MCNLAMTFLVFFTEKLNILLHNSFIAQQQSYLYRELKLKLKTGEIFVIYDFSENYSIIQDEVQGFQCNKAQVTLSVYGLLFIKLNDRAHQFCYFIRLFKM
jgi:hypothetical protein